MKFNSNLEAEMNLKLFKSSEQGKLFTNFDANGLLRGSPNDRVSFYDKMVKVGAMTINEVRERENMNMVEGGDELYVSNQIQPIADADDPEPDPIIDEPPTNGEASDETIENMLKVKNN